MGGVVTGLAYGCFWFRALLTSPFQCGHRGLLDPVIAPYDVSRKNSHIISIFGFPSESFCTTDTHTKSVLIAVFAVFAVCFYGCQNVHISSTVHKIPLIIITIFQTKAGSAAASFVRKQHRSRTLHSLGPCQLPLKQTPRRFSSRATLAAIHTLPAVLHPGPR